MHRRANILRMGFLAGLLGLAGVAHGAGKARVVVNGTVAPVHFNDGDSFRVLGGKMDGTKARLQGFNTLESHGPVHSWGGWTAKELYINAKMATLHARKGSWTCSAGGDLDTYGRMLFDCPDLRQSHIKNGFAHTMTITADPAPANLVKLQDEAIANKRGMWAHGAPEYVLTSLHSADEDPSRAYHYNRVVSTKDGHSEKLRHKTTYKECETVCVDRVTMTPEVVKASRAALRADTSVADLTGEWSDDQVHHVLNIWLKLNNTAALIGKRDRKRMTTALEKLTSSGVLEEQSREKDSCMVYVHFRRRYGGGRASCLK